MGQPRSVPLSPTENRGVPGCSFGHSVPQPCPSKAPTVSSCHCTTSQWVFWQGTRAGTSVCTLCCDEQAHLKKSWTGNPIPCSQLCQTQCLLWFLHEPHGLLKTPAEIQKADIFIRPRFAGKATASLLGNILGSATQKRLKIQFVSSAENRRQWHGITKCFSINSHISGSCGFVSDPAWSLDTVFGGVMMRYPPVSCTIMDC